MPDHKDHLHEKLHDKEKAEEDRYFAEHSKKQVEKIRQAHATAAAAGTVNCPRCGAALEVKQRNGIALEACPQDHGVWLPMRELDQITKREGDGWLSRLLLGRR